MKNIVKTTVALLCLLCLVSGTSVAQNSSEIRFLGLLPLSNYGRVEQTIEMIDNGEIASGAAIGGGLGYRYCWDLSMGISFIAGADLLWNGTSTKYRDILDANLHETAPQYFNLPIQIGVGMSSTIGDSKWAWFFDATAGLNIHYTTSTGWSNKTVSYKPAFSAALTAQGGIKYRQLSLGLTLISLGSPTMKVASGDEQLSQFPVDNLKRAMLMTGVVVSYKISKKKKEWKPSRKTILD